MQIFLKHLDHHVGIIDDLSDATIAASAALDTKQPGPPGWETGCPHRNAMSCTTRAPYIAVALALLHVLIILPYNSSHA